MSRSSRIHLENTSFKWPLLGLYNILTVFFPIGFLVARCHKLLGNGVVVLNFKYQLTHSKRIWRGGLNKGLSRSGWPVGMSVGVYLAHIK